MEKAARLEDVLGKKDTAYDCGPIINDLKETQDG